MTVPVTQTLLKNNLRVDTLVDFFNFFFFFIFFFKGKSIDGRFLLEILRIYGGRGFTLIPARRTNGAGNVGNNVVLMQIRFARFRCDSTRRSCPRLRIIIRTERGDLKRKRKRKHWRARGNAPICIAILPISATRTCTRATSPSAE